MKKKSILLVHLIVANEIERQIPELATVALFFSVAAVILQT